MTSQKLKDYASKAADRIEQTGWTTGSLEVLTEWGPGGEWVKYTKDTCKVCVLGALGYVHFGDPAQGMDDDQPEYVEIIDELADHIYPGWRESESLADDFDDEITSVGAVYTWNDQIIQDEAQLISQLREIAAS